MLLLSRKTAFILTGIVGVFGTQSAQAATLLVPDSFSTINDAISASDEGDSIRITDSAIYHENLVISKRIHIEAAVGQNPVIQGTGAASSVIWTDDRSLGSRIGSLQGGRIVIDGGGLDAIAVLLGNGHSQPGQVEFENLTIRNPAAGASMIYPAVAGNSVFRDVSVDAGNVCQFPIRLDFLGGAEMTFEGCSLTNAPDIGFFCGNPTGYGTVNLSDCNIEAHKRPFLIQPTSGPFIFNIQRSWIRNVEDTQSWTTFSLRGDATELNLSDSVVENRGAGYIAFFFAGYGNMAVQIDHCDLIGDTIGFGFQDASNRSFSISNSNVVTGSLGFFGSPAAGDALSFNNNNVTGGYGSFPSGTNDVNPALQPNYFDPDGADFRYTTPGLLTGDSSGGPVGSYRNFDFMIQPTATPTLTATFDPNATATPTPTATQTPDPNVTPTPTQLSQTDLDYIAAFHQVFSRREPPFTVENYPPFDRFNGSTLTTAIAQMWAGQRTVSDGFGYWMEAYNEMYLLTGETIYATEHLRLIREVMNYRDDVRGIPLFTGNIEPVWGRDEFLSLGRYAFAVDDGLALYPILRFLYIAQQRTEVMALFNEGEFDSILEMLQGTLDYYNNEYVAGPGPDEAFLILMHDNTPAVEGTPQPANWMSSLGRAYWMSWKVTGNTGHRDKALALGRYMKNRISLATDGAYYWGYWLPIDPVAATPVPRETIRGRQGFDWIEDVAHGSLTISYWILLAGEGEIFTEEDMERLARTVRLGFARLNNGVLFPDVVGNPIVSLISRVPNVQHYLLLTRYDREVYERITDFYFHYWPSPGPLENALILGEFETANTEEPSRVSFWRFY